MARTSSGPTPFVANSGYGPRYIWLTAAAAILFGLLTIRLWQLQVVGGEEYARLSENNRTRIQDIAPFRGVLLDRHGEVLVDNQAGFTLTVILEDVKDESRLIAEVARLTRRCPDELAARYQALSPELKSNVQVWLPDLSMAEVVALETRRYRLTGLDIGISAQRGQLNSLLASHIIGYLGEVTKDQLARPEFSDYRPGDLIGQTGVEKSMERLLRGKRGHRVVEVNTHERVLRELERDDPQPGHNVQLTIDHRLQAIAQELLGYKAGAVVALDPRNFEILALASSPNYDLADFNGGVSKAKWRELNQDPFHPLQNRAISGMYPPGSTFKIVTAIAALEEKLITPRDIVICPGSYRLGNQSFGCWNRRGHGAVNLERALKVSCDVYFYAAGLKLGPDKLAEWGKKMGVGRTCGLDLPGEQAGHLPTTAWKQRRFKEPWQRGESLPISIGQGYVLATPLQVAMFTAVAANGGVLYRPHVVKAIYDANGEVLQTVEKEVISRLSLKPEDLRAVQKGLQAVVNEGGGTGGRARLPNIAVAGKSGTSQVVSLKTYQAYSRGGLPYKYRDHAWFTAYAPAENPQLVVTVLLEHTGGGGANAAPLAGKMLEAYFDHSIVAKSLPPAMIQPDQPPAARP